MFWKFQRSLSFKIGLLSCSMIVLSILSATFFLWQTQKQWLLSSLRKQGETLCETLASNSRYGMWTGDVKELQKKAQDILSFPSVALIWEETEEKELLFWKHDPSRISPSEAKAWASGTRSSSSAYLHFSSPIRIAEPEPGWNPTLVTPSLKTLGHADVLLSTREMQNSLHDLQNNVIRITVLLLSVFALLTIPFCRSITTPLHRLVEATRQIASGNFDVRVPPATSDEIGLLSESFKKMAQTLQDKQSQVTHMEKIASLGKLSGGLAHEFNNILGVMRGEAEGSLDVDRQNFYRDSMKTILKAVESGSLITTNLLNYAKPSPPRMESTLLHSVIENSLLLMKQNFIHYQIQVEKNYQVFREIRVDPHQMQQVFLNIFTNARDAMRNGGILSIETRQEESHLIVAIQNSGPPVPEEFLEKVFDAFFTTKGNTPHLSGTGLGLTVCREIVQAHGGSMKLENVPSGVRVSLRLPFLA